MPLPSASDLPTGTVTFLFTDIQGSTQLVQKLGTDRWKETLTAHYEILRKVFDGHRGKEVGTEGDAFFVAFASATDAVAACVDGQRALEAHPWPEDGVIRVRMGLHTGEAAMAGGNYMGLDVHRAARIASTGHGGQVVLSGATKALVEGNLPDGVSLLDLGEHRLKDLAHPEQIFQLNIQGLPSEFPALKSLDHTPNNLPTQLTSFVGRDRELAEGIQLLETNRLLTLTGPGGTGKTRLSLQIAAEVSGAFKDGAFFVPLAPISEPDLVPSTIMQALSLHDAGGGPPGEFLLDYLRDREMLLVLDNFEQLLEAAPYVGAILKASPGSKVLAASRAPLRVYGEQEFPVPPLDVPSSKETATAEALSRYEAVKLFIDRAVAVKPDFTLTTDNGAAVAEITALVDGLPLAIELAAARVKLLTPQAMLTRLQTRLGELGGGARDAPERQQTLRGAIAWSYDLLDEGAKRVFAQFAVFVGGGSLEQVEAVCGPPDDAHGDVLDGMSTLVDHNLLRPVADQDEPRFAMLHVIREFALQRLGEEADASGVHQRHADAFLQLAQTAAPQLTTASQRDWLDRLDLEHDNLDTALVWAIGEGRGDIAAGLVAALWRFWQMRGHLYEGRQRADEVLAIPDLQQRSAERYAALEAAGGIAYWRGDIEAAQRMYNENVSVARERDDKKMLAEALYNAAYPMLATLTNLSHASELLLEATALFRELGDEAGIANSLGGSATILSNADPPDLRAAIPLLQEARDRFRKLDNRFGLAWVLARLGRCLVEVGEHDDGATALRESLSIFAAANDMSGIGLLFNAIASLALTRGDRARAARLDGARAALDATSGVGIVGRSAVFARQVEDLAKLVQTEPEAYAQGHAMPVAEAIAFALEEEPAL